MENPNDNVVLYNGEIVLKTSNDALECTGQIILRWLPSPKVGLDAELDYPVSKYNGTRTFTVSVGGFDIDELRLEYGGGGSISHAKAEFTRDVVIGNTTAKAQFVTFTIQNLRYIRVIGEIVLVNSKFTVNLRQKDQCEFNILGLKGGYHTTYTGTVKSNSGSNISFSETLEITKALGVYLSFLNGSKTVPSFMEGFVHHERSVKSCWKDCSSPKVDSFKEVTTWLPDSQGTQLLLSPLWKNFYDQYLVDPAFFDSIVRWYTESNRQAGDIEGSIIMAQAGLELLYNWLVVEKSGIIKGKDSSDISAANKIRLLLNYLRGSYGIPSKLADLAKLAREEGNSEVADGPGIVVYVRNAIVHSNPVKRKKLQKIHPAAKEQALLLALSYVELALIKIIGHSGSYFDRCDSKLKMVPWSEKG